MGLNAPVKLLMLMGCWKSASQSLNSINNQLDSGFQARTEIVYIFQAVFTAR